MAKKKNIIKELRLAKAMTLRDLEDKTGISRQSILNIENGYQNPKIETAEKIAAALGLNDWRELFGGKQEAREYICGSTMMPITEVALPSNISKPMSPEQAIGIVHSLGFKVIEVVPADDDGSCCDYVRGCSRFGLYIKFDCRYLDQQCGVSFSVTKQDTYCALSQKLINNMRELKSSVKEATIEMKNIKIVEN